MDNRAAVRALLEGAVPEVRPASPASDPSPAARRGPVDALRTFLTLLVVAHHSVLAYLSWLPPASGALTDPPLLWGAFPVVDPQRWPGIDLFSGFNDTFFMSLLFLISGLFVWPSLQRKGSVAVLKARFLRLGLPFLVVALLAPLAYLPAFLQRQPGGGLAAFAAQWGALPSWPAGPAWFLWVLLAFDVLAAALFAWAPRAMNSLAAAVSARSARPAAFFLLLLVLSSAGYIPLSLLVSPYQWPSIGPFAVQAARLAHYAVYFFVGAALGAQSAPLLSVEGKLARRWPLWAFAALFAFAVAGGLYVAFLGHAGSQAWLAFSGFGFTLSCACSSLFFLSLFARFRSTDRARGALSLNAYGIYLTHYFFVSWLQLGLLGIPVPAPLKAAAVFAGAVALSAGLTVLLRRIPAVARVL